MGDRRKAGWGGSKERKKEEGKWRHHTPMLKKCPGAGDRYRQGKKMKEHNLKESYNVEAADGEKSDVLIRDKKIDRRHRERRTNILGRGCLGPGKKGEMEEIKLA